MPKREIKISVLTTFLRRLVLLWIRFSTSWRQWTGLSPGYGVKSVLAAILIHGSFFSVIGLESSCAARARTWQNKNENRFMIILTYTKSLIASSMKAHSHCCFHLQDIEPLAKTVVQGVKLCGQILSHLSSEAKKQRMVIELCGNECKSLMWNYNWGDRSYRDAVSDGESHHGRLSETQEAIYAVFILHVKKHFGHLDTDLKKA